jgi:hypothetical protein
MTKTEVLTVFARTREFLSPRDVCNGLRGYHQHSSVCSYLLRLQRQGLVERQEVSRRVFYRISKRGIERLAFLTAQKTEWMIRGA